MQKWMIEDQGMEVAEPSPNLPDLDNHELPVHFLTMVSDEMPCLDHHLAVFRQLLFPWHWHLVESCVENSPEIGGAKSHPTGTLTDRLGSDTDRISIIFDRIQREFPNCVTIHRTPRGVAWTDYVQSANVPLNGIRPTALLWLLNANELWTSSQFVMGRELFLRRPEKTAALYRCHPSGSKLVRTSGDAQDTHEKRGGLRTWRFTAGCRWLSLEPPRLARPAESDGALLDLSKIDPFTEEDTEAAGLVFPGFACATEAEATEDDSGPAGVIPLVEICPDGACSFPNIPPSPPKTRILVVRTDSIGDSVLAAGMLPRIRCQFAGSQVAVLCRSHVSELWIANPYVDSVICFDWQQAFHDANYFESIADEIIAFAPDLVLNTLFSREPLTEKLLRQGAPNAESIAFVGDLANISAAEKASSDGYYTRLIPADVAPKLELTRHREFLEGIGAPAGALQPEIWTFPADEQLAAAFFKEQGLDPSRSLAVFPGAQQSHRIYPHYAAALAPLDGYDFIFFGGLETRSCAEKIAHALRGRCFVLAGQTTLRETAALMRRCRLFVGNDSAGAHIACAVGIPNVVVYGGGQLGRFFPYSNLTTAVSLPLDCAPCNWQCRFATTHCVQDVDPHLVTTAIQDALRTPNASPRVLVQTHFTTGPGRPQLKESGHPAAIAPLRAPVAEPDQSYLHISGRTPLVSAIVSAYNSERFMAGCLEDLEQQSIADDVEIIVIDSGSTQNESSIVERFQARFGNIRYLRTPRETLYAAWNRAVSISRGKFLTSANTDDRHSPKAFERLASLLERQGCGLAYANSLITRIENETFQSNHAHAALTWPDYSLRQLLCYSMFGPQPLWRRDAHQHVGLFDPSLQIAGDYEFFIRLAFHSGAVHDSELLGLYFEGGLESQNAGRARAETRRLLAHHRQGATLEQLYPALAEDPGDQLARAAAALDWSNTLLSGLYPNVELAQLWLGRARDIFPDHAAILNNTAVIQCITGNIDAARPTFARLARMLPHAASNAAQLDALSPTVKPAFVLAGIDHPVTAGLPKLVPPSETRSPVDHAPMPGALTGAAEVSPATGDRPAWVELTTACSNSSPISFCVITAGKRPALLAIVIASIRAQKLAEFEIIIAGAYSDPDPNVLFVPAPEAAAECRRGTLRQVALEQARFDRVMFLDDDCILSPDWGRNLERAPAGWDILTFQMRLPDGTRYWDHATHGGPAGHRILEATDHDPNVYATSGAFLARRALFQHVQWDLKAAEFEDLEFSRRCRRFGYRIVHCHDAVVFHADRSYSSVGRTVHRRSHPSQRWCLELPDTEPGTLLRLASTSASPADAADLLRFGRARHPNDPGITRTLSMLEQHHGGLLSDNRWFLEDDPDFLRATAQFGQRSDRSASLVNA